MMFHSINGFLALGAPAQPGGAQPNPTAQMMQTLGMFAIMGVMFYFVLIRPQQKKSKELANLLKALKPGDKILTGSGIVGLVVTVKEKTVTIRSADTKLEVLKTAVTEITEVAGSSAES